VIDKRARGAGSLVLSCLWLCEEGTGCFVPAENQDTSSVKCDTVIVLVFFKWREKREKMAARPVITKKSYTIEQEEGNGDASPKYIIMVKVSGKEVAIQYCIVDILRALVWLSHVPASHAKILVIWS
jgi:hypothetical protein